MAAGRCYLMQAAGHRDVWRWTLYKDTLEEAQRRFKEAYERAVEQWKDKHGSAATSRNGC
jgi:hypothetical protein